MRGGRRSALAGAVLLLEVLVAACGRPGSGAEKPEATSSAPKPATVTATAPARFDEETELLYRTASDPCQSLTLKAKLTRNFDGWSKVAAADDSRHLRFTNGSLEWLTRLRWSRAEGFAEVENIRR